MKGDQLSELFFTLSESGEHIAGLRRLVVALAIGERLGSTAGLIGTPPPKQLSQGFSTHRHDSARLHRGSVKPVTQEELPEGFPHASAFLRLGDVAKIEKGRTGIKQAQRGPYKLVVTGAERLSCDHFDFDTEAAIVPLVSSTGHGNASLNRLHFESGKFALGTILAAAIPLDPTLMSARFLFEYLSAFKDELLVPRMTGTANVTLTIGKLAEVPVPLVSRETQLKVDELMALLDRLDAARNAREATRDRLTTASLTRLTAADTDPETLRTHARFALDALPALTTRADQIKQLRQTILNLAVRGKLVAQSALDEPAELQLRLIEEERAAFGRSSAQARRDSDSDSHDAERASWSVPSNWRWASVGKLALFTQYGTSAKAYPSEVGVPVLAMGNIQSGRVIVSDQKRISRESEELPALFLKSGDLLYNRTNSAELVGKTGIYLGDDDQATFASYLIRIRLSTRYSSSKYVNMAMNCEDFRLSQILPHIKKQTGQANVSGSALRGMLVPVPPLAEQQRIVAKVDELMALCDRLEAALQAADTTRARLLEALLHEALAAERAQAA